MKTLHKVKDSNFANEKYITLSQNSRELSLRQRRPKCLTSPSTSSRMNSTDSYDCSYDCYDSMFSNDDYSNPDDLQPNIEDPGKRDLEKEICRRKSGEDKDSRVVHCQDANHIL